MEILNLEESPRFDDSIEGIEFHSHHPYTSNKFKAGDEIRISVQHQDIYTLPSQSYLYLAGRLLKHDGSTVATVSKLTNNAFAFLFDEIRYELCGSEIDKVRNPGITSSLKGLASFKQTSENFGWCYPSSNRLSNISTEGHFNVCLPLSMLLGFGEDYEKVIINVKQELVLIRSRQDDNCYINQSGSEERSKIELTMLCWKLPYVSVSEYQRLNLMRHLKSEKILSVSFRSWELYEYPMLPVTRRQVWAVKTSNQMEKPRYVILAFQTGRENSVDKDASGFDHCNISNVKLFLNSKSYPYDDLNLNFERNQFALLYYMYASFQSSFYPGSPSQPILTPSEFKEKAPLVIIDCSHQSESIKSGPVDVRVEFESNSVFPSNTTAYCLIIHDRVVEYNPLTNIVRRMM